MMKKTLTILPVFAALVFAGPAMAQSTSFQSNSGSPLSVPTYVPAVGDRNAVFNGKRVGNGSSTASRAYRIGVRAYDKGELDAAEASFMRGFHADGLDAQIMHYFIKIAEQKGETQKAASYRVALNNFIQAKTPRARSLSRIPEDVSQ